MRFIRKAASHAGLKGKLLLSVALAFAVSVAVFVVLYSCTVRLIDTYFADEDRWVEMTESKADEFQEYITENEYSMHDTDAIRSWNVRNAGVYLYIYTPKTTVYETARSVAAYSYENYRQVKFTDGTADMSIFYAIDYRYYMLATVFDIMVSAITFFLIVLRRISKIVEAIKGLENDVKILEGGGLDHVIEVHSRDEIGSLEKSLNDMRLALKGNIEREEELTRANNDLITRMAHDLRTPLTSLLLYLDLLEGHRYTSEDQMRKYLRVSRDKAENIKFMSDQLFERFLITGERDEETEGPLQVRYVFEDVLSTFVMTLETQGFTTSTLLGWPDGKIIVSQNYIQRIIDNIYSNILKYADRSYPVKISLTAEASRAMTLRISNHIGNRKSTEGGSNIGLENIQLMLEKMDGALVVNDDGEIFELIIRIPFAE